MEIENVTFRPDVADFTELFAKTGRTVIVALGCARGCARAADKCLGKHNLSGRGVAPDESVDMVHGFLELEASAARCHDHAISWVKSTHFKRLTWDADAVFGLAATWGNWRDAPLVDRDIAEVLEEVEETVCALWRPLARRQSALTYFMPICGSQIRWWAKRAGG